MDYEDLISNKKSFYDFVYTPLSEAIKILEERQKDGELIKKIENILGEDNIPSVFKDKGLKGFQFRQIATPNHESLTFIKIAKDFDIKPIFCEHHNDKFTTNNFFKLSLGQIKINNGFDKNNDIILEKINVIDIKNSDGLKIKEIKTLWGESMIDMHKNLFKCYNFCKDISFINMSEWYNQNGNNPYSCYKNIFMFFIVHGIMFENFLDNKDEYSFTKDIILPTLKEVSDKIGLKPLIVPIPPMEREKSKCLVYHSPEIKKYLKDKR